VTATLTNNGPAPRTRRQLDDSIARMDGMIEGLSDAIPGAVKEALEEHVGPAIANGIKAAVLEVLSNPDLMNTLRGVLPQQEPPTSRQGPQGPIIVPMPRPSLIRNLAGKVGSAVTGTATWCREQVGTAAKSNANTAQLVINKLADLRRRMWILRFLPKSVLVALTLSGVAAAVAVLAPNWTIAALSCLSAVVAAGLARLATWFRRTTLPLHLSTD
jgi:hypothetical protein